MQTLISGDRIRYTPPASLTCCYAPAFACGRSVHSYGHKRSLVRTTDILLRTVSFMLALCTALFWLFVYYFGEFYVFIRRPIWQLGNETRCGEMWDTDQGFGSSWPANSLLGQQGGHFVILDIIKTALKRGLSFFLYCNCIWTTLFFTQLIVGIAIVMSSCHGFILHVRTTPDLFISLCYFNHLNWQR